MDVELFSEQVQIERKTFSLVIRENPRGRFLKLTEDVGGRRDAVIIPVSGLVHIRDIIARAVQCNASLPPCEVQIDEGALKR